MTDSKLRELERRWKESGSVEDEAAYLLERVRVGDLEKEKLELAAYCGHQGARTALGDRAPTAPSSLQAWIADILGRVSESSARGVLLSSIAECVLAVSDMRRGNSRDLPWALRLMPAANARERLSTILRELEAVPIQERAPASFALLAAARAGQKSGASVQDAIALRLAAEAIGDSPLRAATGRQLALWLLEGA